MPIRLRALEVSPVGDIQIPFHIYHKSSNPRKIQDGTEVKSHDRKFLSHSRKAGNMQHGYNWHMFKSISPLGDNHGGKSQGAKLDDLKKTRFKIAKNPFPSGVLFNNSYNLPTRCMKAVA